MLGAMIGDIVGSPYEQQERNIKIKEFPLFSIYSRITDDSVLTCAVAAAFMEYLRFPKSSNLQRLLVQNLKDFGNSHTSVPYGKHFRQWMEDFHDCEPYNSFSDGSAMRVSPVAWLFDTLEKEEAMAKVSAEVTHKHPEGIKGAQAIAAAVFLARNGKNKDCIRDYIQSRYYEIDFTLDEIRPEYYGSLECAETVPQAIVSFLEADSFEDALRNAVSLGGDSDTLAAMAGSIAEAYFGIPQEIKEQAMPLIPDDLLAVYRQFQARVAKHD